MSFDEWIDEAWKNKDFWNSHTKSSKMGYEAGAASRQAEIDELQKRINEALNFYNIAKSDVNIGMMQMAIYLKGKEND